jgi:hypothetical protein
MDEQKSPPLHKPIPFQGIRFLTLAAYQELLNGSAAQVYHALGNLSTPAFIRGGESAPQADGAAWPEAGKIICDQKLGAYPLTKIEKTSYFLRIVK